MNLAAGDPPARWAKSAYRGSRNSFLPFPLLTYPKLLMLSRTGLRDQVRQRGKFIPVKVRRNLGFVIPPLSPPYDFKRYNGRLGMSRKYCLTGLCWLCESCDCCINHAREETKMEQPVYRNTAFKKRDYDCTYIVACQPIDGGTAIIPKGYEPADSSILIGLTPLWIQGGVRYFGYL
jgi:hypothetical protein